MPHPLGETLAPGGKDDRLPIRIPADHAIARPMVGYAPGFATGDGHDIDVVATLVVAAEGDFPAIRRKARPGFLTAGRTQAEGCSTLLRHYPDVARIDKGDL